MSSRPRVITNNIKSNKITMLIAHRLKYEDQEVKRKN